MKLSSSKPENPAGASRRCVTDADRRRLGRLLASQECHVWGKGRWRADLECVLEQAQAVDPRQAPAALVTMNTTVTLTELATKQLRTVTLVYPDDMDLVSDSISVFDPLGVALIGCRAGDVIQCPAEQCQRRFCVSEIDHQPEQAGAWHR